MKISVTSVLKRAWMLMLLIVPALLVSCSYQHTSALPGGGDQMRTTYEVRHISVSINRPPDEVYNFISNLENLPKWATDLGGPIKNVNCEWIADAPMGKVKIKFAEKNKFGILDHEVFSESGVKVYNPVRAKECADPFGMEQERS